VHDYVEELVAFPNAPTDDQVDATSQALQYLNRSGTKGTIKVDVF
jgi:phage terminase large subunit-like protein